MYKKLLLSIVAIAAISTTTFGQAPEGFKYQAVIRDAGNIVMNNQAVGMQIEILQGGISGTPIYTESFAPTTNAYGLVNLEIGTGSTTDDFSTIDWANDTYFIRTSFDATGGSSYIVMGTSQLMSVPYALHAKTAGSVLNDQVDDADADPTNEIQDITLSGTNLSLSNGSTIDLSVIDTDTDTQLSEAAVDAMVANNGYITSPDDADADPTNEIQDITLSGTNLSLSDGSTIDLSVIDTDTDTHIDSTGIAALGYVAGSHKIVDYSMNEQATGRFWIDGKEIYSRTYVRPSPSYPNWTVTYAISFAETIVNVEYILISDIPFTNSRTYNSSHAFVTWDNPGSPGSIVMTSADGTTHIKAGSTLTVYYTKL